MFSAAPRAPEEPEFKKPKFGPLDVVHGSDNNLDLDCSVHGFWARFQALPSVHSASRCFSSKSTWSHPSRSFLAIQTSNSPFTDCVHVHTHRGNLAAAVLVKFVAARLTPEAVEEKLVAEITVGQFEERFPYLRRPRGDNENTFTSGMNEGSPATGGGDSQSCAW